MDKKKNYLSRFAVLLTITPATVSKMEFLEYTPPEAIYVIS